MKRLKKLLSIDNLRKALNGFLLISLLPACFGATMYMTEEYSRIYFEQTAGTRW